MLKAKIVKALAKIHAMNLSPEEAATELTKAVPELLAANKSPDSLKIRDIISAPIFRIQISNGADRISENVLAR